jgi:addiction module HigA family antidote
MRRWVMAKVKKKLSPIHPGEILLEELMKPLGLSANKLALELRVPSNRIVAIVSGKRAMSADTALRLARYFNTSADLWMNLQARYDLQRAEDELAEAIAREVRPRDAA